jgi:hypothetical protein
MNRKKSGSAYGKVHAASLGEEEHCLEFELETVRETAIEKSVLSQIESGRSIDSGDHHENEPRFHFSGVAGRHFDYRSHGRTSLACRPIGSRSGSGHELQEQFAPNLLGR